MCLKFFNIVIIELDFVMNLNQDLLTQKDSVGEILGWIFGSLFLFGGLIGVANSDFFLGLIVLLMGLAILPPIAPAMEKNWGFKLTFLKKTVVLFIGFFLFVFNSGPDSSETQNSAAVSDNLASTVEISQEVPATIAETSAAQDAGIPVEPEKKLYPVIKAIDGDTISVDVDGVATVLRLIGINTPETVDPRKPVECFGTEASNKAKDILTGKKVSLESDDTQSDRDKYNRPLRYIFLEDGTNFNKLMIEEGYAYEYTYDIPYKYQAEFKDAQQKAEASKMGLWAGDTCSGKLNGQTSGAIKPQSTTAITEKSLVTTTPTFSGGSCGSKTKCGQMISCEEAKYYLNSCGVSRLDGDKDGVPCEALCN